MQVPQQYTPICSDTHFLGDTTGSVPYCPIAIARVVRTVDGITVATLDVQIAPI